MTRSADLDSFRLNGDAKLDLNAHPTTINKPYDGKSDYRAQIKQLRSEINDLQQMMYAHDRYSLLLIFQAMDAAGKDGTIRAVLSGVNPHGVSIHAFKKPSAEELDHDFLWRTTVRLPQRGRIGVFNRSYYEEVLVARVHPKIVRSYQKLPDQHTRDLDALWRERYSSIRDFEQHLERNGTRVLKFFLHLGRDEQRARFLDRIDEPEKNWKFSESDMAERQHWDRYQQCYADAINATATPDAPWFVVPADDKKAMRLIVARTIRDELRRLDMRYPQVTDERRTALQGYREQLLKD
ncbi:MAG: polyphosphate kinase 2 family protein [Pseudomonadota bacterium]